MKGVSTRSRAPQANTNHGLKTGGHGRRVERVHLVPTLDGGLGTVPNAQPGRTHPTGKVPRVSPVPPGVPVG